MINFRNILIAAVVALSAAQSFAQSSDQHGLKWETLLNLDGKYLQDKVSTKTLAAPLKSLFGGKYSEFMDSIKVQTPMEIENGLLIVQGMAPHSGGEYASLAFFSMSGSVLGIIRKDKDLLYFGDKKILENPMAKEVLQSFKK
ncbi:MAG: hypothetical protein Q7J75_00305 [Rhodoferax sp.]|nr:hypothetical protein [Rhodoferax sp.]